MRTLVIVAVLLAATGCSVTYAPPGEAAARPTHYAEFAATLTAEVPTPEPPAGATVSPPLVVWDDDAIVSGLKLTMQVGGVEPDDVLLVEAPPELGGRTCVVAWLVPPEYASAADLLPSLGSMFGAVAGAREHTYGTAIWTFLASPRRARAVAAQLAAAVSVSPSVKSSTAAVAPGTRVKSDALATVAPSAVRTTPTVGFHVAASLSVVNVTTGE